MKIHETTHPSGFSLLLKHNHGGMRWLLLTAAASTGVSTVNLLTTAILKAFTDYATGQLTSPLSTLVGGAMGVVLVGSLFLILRSLSMRMAYHVTESGLRLRAMDVLSRCSLLALQKHHSAEITARLTKDTETTANCLPQLISTLMGGCLTAVLALAYMFCLNWKLSLAVLLAIPAMLLLIRLFSPKLQSSIQADKRHEDSIRSHMENALDHLLLIQTYQAQPLLFQKLNQALRCKQQSIRTLGLVEGTFSFLNTATGMLTFLVTMGFGAYLTAQGACTMGSMVAVVNLINYVTWPLSNISQSMSQLRQALVSVQRLEELFSLPISVPAQEEHLTSSDGVLILENVTFSYPDSAPILSNVCAAFHTRRLIGIYGPSGSGKSTLLRLLLGVYSPQRGMISFGGIVDLRSLVSYVPSSQFIYPGTIRENILMNAPDDPARLFRCIRLSNLQSVISALPDGLDTFIGDGGQDVSSGQAQRIAIARAIYRDTPILILDEPSSNLDQESILLLKKTLKALAEERLIILVSHESDFASICDEVYLLRRGKLETISADRLVKEMRQESVNH